MASTWLMILGTLIVILAWFFLILRIRWLGLGRIGGMLLCSMLMLCTTVESSDEAVGLFERVAPSLVTILSLDVMVILLSRQHLYDRISHFLTWKCTSALEMIVRVSLVVAILSAFLSADTVTMALTPIIVQMCERHDLPHGPFLVAVATSANIGATCTPLGSIQNIVIISLSRLSYVSFVRFMGPATAFALGCNIILLFIYYWKQLKGITIQWTHGKLMRGPEHKVYVRAMRRLERQHEKEYKHLPKWRHVWFEVWTALNPSTASASCAYAMECLKEYEKQQNIKQYYQKKKQDKKQSHIQIQKQDVEEWRNDGSHRIQIHPIQQTERDHHISHVHVHVQPSTRQPSPHSQHHSDDQHHQHDSSHPHIYAHEAEYQPSHSSSHSTSSSPSQHSPDVRMAGNELDVAHRMNHVQLRDDIPGNDVMSQMAHYQAQATRATLEDESTADEWVDPAHANAGEARHRVQHCRRMDDRFGGMDSIDEQIMEMAEEKQMGDYTCDSLDTHHEDENEHEKVAQHGKQLDLDQQQSVHHDFGHHENDSDSDSDNNNEKSDDILHQELAPSAHHPSCPQHEYPSKKDMLIIVRKMQLDQYIDLGLLPRSAAVNMDTQTHSRNSKHGQSKRDRFSWKHRHEIPPKPECTCQGRKKTPLDMQSSQSSSQHIVDIPMQNMSSSPVEQPRFHISPMSQQQNVSHDDVEKEKPSQHHKHRQASHHQSDPAKKSHDVPTPAPPISPTSRLRAVIPAYRPTFVRVSRAWLPRQRDRPLVILPPSVVHPHFGGDRKLLLFLAIFITTIGLYLADWPIHWVTLAGAVAMIVVDLEEPEPVLQAIDWGAVVYLVALVIVIGGFQKTGIPEAFWDKIRYTVEPADGAGIAYFSLLVFIGSNLFSNLPLILLVQTLIFSMNDPFTSWLILAWITSVAGNLTLMGSVTNLIVTQRAKTYYMISQAEYGRFGLPSTLLLRVIGVVVIAWRTKGDANILLH